MEQTKREQHDVITGRNAVLESLISEAGTRYDLCG